MHELSEKFTNYLAYVISAVGMLFGTFSLEQWYFISSMALGLITVLINLWHKRKMQSIAKEQGVFRNENP
ncbi:phage holin family protein [Vibrio sp.]|uniref:Holin n=1 Tax=Vibrio viridaestus TaxID=2487322 RepID=A0A3N9TIJ3_9VIBR|nr:HP1 family phage holin [Vibrio viridaestus]MDC0611895.1 phage holin family protein [Vibrio sp.]RQW64031.1 hypothetical protein EES38_05350 [Vibrio viridaestus]